MTSSKSFAITTRVATGFAKFLLTAAAAMAIACAQPKIALGDTLELKTGEIMQGRFVGGSALNIRFQINGQEQIFATKDVLNIGFDDTSNSSNYAPPPPDAQSNPPNTDANDPPAPPPNNPQPQSDYPSQNSNAPQNANVQAITVPAGTSVLIRMVDSVDSSQNRIGDIFHASLESPLMVNDTVVAPKGADVYGKLSQAKEAGQISGNAQLTLEMTGIRINGNIVPVDSTDYDVAGKNRGKQSAERIGGGAVAGAVIGGIIGGGRGAAVGATLGAGGGAAVQVLTHGDQVRVPSETLLEFKLQQDITAPVTYSSN